VTTPLDTPSHGAAPDPVARQPRAERTRKRLLEAGRRAFAARGLAAANLREDILAPSGISVGSFYHRYRDKTELLVDILQLHADDFRARVREVHRPRPGRTPEHIARDAYTLIFDVADRDADILRIRMRERDCADPRVRQQLESDRRAWIRSMADDFERIPGTRATAAQIELVAELVVTLAVGAIGGWLELADEERTAARDRLLEGLVVFTLGGAIALLGEPSSSSPPQKSRET
jgi:AcrR family transcriptional regulator